MPSPSKKVRAYPSDRNGSCATPAPTLSARKKKKKNRSNEEGMMDSSPAAAVPPPPTYEELFRTTGLPKSLSYRKICSRCGKMRSEHRALGFGNKCVLVECGKCGATSDHSKRINQLIGILCWLTVEQGGIPGSVTSSGPRCNTKYHDSNTTTPRRMQDSESKAPMAQV
jgi:hypothetical protein